MLVKQGIWFCEMCVTSKPLGVKTTDGFQKAIAAWQICLLVLSKSMRTQQVSSTKAKHEPVGSTVAPLGEKDHFEISLSFAGWHGHIS